MKKRNAIKLTILISIGLVILGCSSKYYSNQKEFDPRPQMYLDHR